MYFTVYNPSLLDSKIINGNPLTTQSSLAVVSFKYNKSHLCCGVFHSQTSISTSMECGNKLMEHLKENNLTTANFAETERLVVQVEPVKLSNTELSDIAIVKVSLLINFFLIYLLLIFIET